MDNIINSGLTSALGGSNAYEILANKIVKDIIAKFQASPDEDVKDPGTQNKIFSYIQGEVDKQLGGKDSKEVDQVKNMAIQQAKKFLSSS